MVLTQRTRQTRPRCSHAVEDKPVGLDGTPRPNGNTIKESQRKHMWTAKIIGLCYLVATLSLTKDVRPVIFGDETLNQDIWTLVDHEN